MNSSRTKHQVRDNLKPIIFKYLPPNIIKYITYIYRCCIATHYTPELWKKSKVIFLPKPGKDDYHAPKAFRPISLTNFLLKGLERIIVWRTDEKLLDFPIHPNQHGFTKGKSTESALSAVIDILEKWVFGGKHCLGVFLDISSAFDSVDIGHIRDALYAHGADPDLVEWYYGYLKERLLEVNLQGESTCATTGVGFPQGGVALSLIHI